MSAYYYDETNIIREKQNRMMQNREKHISEILAHCRDVKKMDLEFHWTGRNPVQFLRKQVKDCCHIAGSWCNARGIDCFNSQASERARAMRECLIVEMNILRAALRELQKGEL